MKKYFERTSIALIIVMMFISAIFGVRQLQFIQTPIIQSIKRL